MLHVCVHCGCVHTHARLSRPWGGDEMAGTSILGIQLWCMTQGEERDGEDSSRSCIPRGRAVCLLGTSQAPGTQGDQAPGQDFNDTFIFPPHCLHPGRVRPHQALPHPLSGRKKEDSTLPSSTETSQVKGGAPSSPSPYHLSWSDRPTDPLQRIRRHGSSTEAWPLCCSPGRRPRNTISLHPSDAPGAVAGSTVAPSLWLCYCCG